MSDSVLHPCAAKLPKCTDEVCTYRSCGQRAAVVVSWIHLRSGLERIAQRARCAMHFHMFANRRRKHGTSVHVA